MSNIHVIGIGGIGASFVARYLVYHGHSVTGSDMSENSTVRELKEEGITIHIGHTRDNIPADVDLVLISPAVLSGKPDEFMYVMEHNIPYKTWQEYLGSITANSRTIAVCGAHGKSTTTGMVAMMLIDAGLDPTVMIGTKLAEFGGKNIRVGQSDILVIEADEFHDNFLSYTPTYVICTSYEADHLDYFGTEERYRESFVTFFSKAKENGGKIYVHANSEAQHIAKEVGASIHAVDSVIEFPLNVLGYHNRENASLVYALGLDMGLSHEAASKGLQTFRGTWRRMEHIGDLAGVPVYDDYAHHPTEVKATLHAFKNDMPGKDIIAVFQPHQYSRTRNFLDAFANSFNDAINSYILDIYASRDTEEDKQSVHATDLVTAINSRAPGHAEYAPDLQLLTQKLKEIVEKNPNAVLVFMGAGSISDFARSLV